MENLLDNEMTAKFFNFYGLSLADINSETTFDSNIGTQEKIYNNYYGRSYRSI